MSFLSRYWPYIMAVGGSISVAFLLLFVTRDRKKNRKEPSDTGLKAKVSPLKVGYSVTPEEVKKAQNELRLWELERDIVSYAIRRLYEAKTEGKISEEELDRLVSGYREKMDNIKVTISRGRSILALHELETTQENLLKLFNERFEEINIKIKDLRFNLNIKPVEEPPITKTPSIPVPEKEEEKKRKTTRKNGAEERVKKIKAEVEKVLGRLENIETEE